jgi:hypothetical protein
MNQFYTCDLCGSTILENGTVVDTHGKYPCAYCLQGLSIKDRRETSMKKTLNVHSVNTCKTAYHCSVCGASISSDTVRYVHLMDSDCVKAVCDYCHETVESTSIYSK